DNLVSQTLLSQKGAKGNLGQESYLYYQVPNSLVKPPSTVDIIIKQEQGKKNTIDPKNTQLVIGLETESLGKMVVSMTVKDKNLKFIFNTEFEDVKKLVEDESKTLKKALNDKDYKVENLIVKLSPSMTMIKSYLLPLLGLEHLFRIDTEA
ncbi:MAG: flagellar hook-length control protein FliK, partial [Candidatus Margulisiibacteriota bacterium]